MHDDNDDIACAPALSDAFSCDTTGVRDGNEATSLLDGPFGAAAPRRDSVTRWQQPRIPTAPSALEEQSFRAGRDDGGPAGAIAAMRKQRQCSASSTRRAAKATRCHRSGTDSFSASPRTSPNSASAVASPSSLRT
jgi:hypothetical protein